MSKKVAKKDILSQVKKEEDKIKKKSKKVEEDENSEEEEVNKNQNEVKEQTIEKSDKPKNLKELFGSMGDTQVKPKKKEKDGKQKQKKYEEPGKPKFVGAGGYSKIDNEVKNKQKVVYKNPEGLDKAAKENQEIKHTKDYLEKDTEKQYLEYEKIEKPKFTSNIKEGDENFVELNKNEDVRKYYFIFILFYGFSYWLKIWLIKIMKIKMNIQKIKKEV